MKLLLLAILLPLVSLASPASTTLESFPPCGYNEVYRATYYYQSPGGPECGLTYRYCYASTPPYHEGCTTSYYDVWYAQCYCP